MTTGYSPELCVLLLTLALIPIGCAYERGFERTPAGDFEIKTLPAAKVIVAKDEGEYFDRGNRLFMTLFRYINRNDVAMTVPVAADQNPASMRFFVGKKDWSKLKNDSEVEVVDLPTRTVASHGARGSYTRDNFEAALSRLKAWLEQHPECKSTGDAYAVFWNGPYVPWFLKRFEVHIPVAGPKSK